MAEKKGLEQVTELLGDIADAVREKSGTSDKIPATQIPEKILEIENSTPVVIRDDIVTTKTSDVSIFRDLSKADVINIVLKEIERVGGYQTFLDLTYSKVLKRNGVLWCCYEAEQYYGGAIWVEHANLEARELVIYGGDFGTDGENVIAPNYQEIFNSESETGWINGVGHVDGLMHGTINNAIIFTYPGMNNLVEIFRDNKFPEPTITNLEGTYIDATQSVTTFGEHTIPTIDEENKTLTTSVYVNVPPNTFSTGTITVTENGEYLSSAYNYDGLDKVIVAVIPKLDTKTITENGTYTPDKPFEGFGQVEVNVVENLTSELDEQETTIDSIETIANSLPNAGGANLPTLDPPYIMRSANELLLENPKTNGKFAEGYKIFDNNLQVAKQVIAESKFFLPDLGIGNHSLSAKTYGSQFQDSSMTDSFTYVYHGVGAENSIYGVSWVNDTTTTMTRTDDAVTLGYAINSSTGSIASDFDNVFPWTETTIEYVNGSKFVKFPVMWFRITTDEKNDITGVAVSKVQGTEGKWYKCDEFYYGCYGASLDENDALQSVSGVARLASKNIAQFRTYAQNFGGFQLDLYHKMVMMFLWWIEWATKNSTIVMTGRTRNSGSLGGSAAIPTGGTDTVATPSGFELSYKQMRYHYIEDFVGNLYEFVDGVIKDGNLFVSSDPSEYANNHNNYNESEIIRRVNNNYPISIGWDDANPFLCWSTENVYSSYVAVGFTNTWVNANSTSLQIVYSGSNYNSSSFYNGVSYFYPATVGYAGSDSGGRLLYKP